MEDFFKPKIVYGQFQDSAEYAFAESGVFLSSNEYLMLCPHYNAKCLVAFLNSGIIEWLLMHITGNLGGNAKIGQKSNFIKLSIPILSLDEQNMFATLVDKYLCSNQEEKKILEKTISNSILNFYGFSEEEKCIIESQQSQ